MKIIDKYPEKIKGIFTTYDRMIFKGHLRCLMYPAGRYYYLSQERVLLKEFSSYAESLSAALKSRAQDIAETQGRPYLYLNRSDTDKDGMAKSIMNRDNITEGLICILATVELCNSVRIRKNSEGMLELSNHWRKCLHFYYYYNDATLGLMHIRIQSWFPFTIQIYMNGHEIIAKKLAKEGIEYSMYENSFTFIDQLAKAQKYAKKLERKNWQSTFNYFAKIVNPHLGKIHQITSRGYYWSISQCEIATDVMFDGRDSVEHIYPDFVEHASRCLKAEDILSFYGKKYHGNFKGEITTDRKKRPQGYRVKHRVKTNSIKMYDKWSVLRAETTFNNPREFKVYRKVIRNGKETKAWVPMGKGITNLYDLSQIGFKANNRYLDKLADIPITAHHITDVERICKPTTFKKRRYSSFNPMSKECSKIFLAMLDGAYSVNGFSNKDIRIALYGQAKANDPKISGQITRLLSKFRAHHLIAKIPRSFRYQITEKGYLIMSSVLRLKKIEYPMLMAA